MCQSIIADERLLQEESVDLTDPDEKQWFIEVQTLKNEELKRLAQIEHAKTIQLASEVELAKLNRDKTETVHVTCECGAELKYNGTDSNAVVELVKSFHAQHYNCV